MALISIYLLGFDVEKFLSHGMNNIYRAPVMVIPSVLGRLQGDSGCIVHLFISSHLISRITKAVSRSVGRSIGRSVRPSVIHLLHF